MRAQIPDTSNKIELNNRFVLVAVPTLSPLLGLFVLEWPGVFEPD